MWQDLFFVLWFFFPSGIANVVPIIVAKVPGLREWNYPMDCYLTLNGKRLLGDHKTWRGLLSGMLLGTLSIYLVLWPFTLMRLAEVPLWMEEIFQQPYLYAFLLSLGALFGDALKSFMKRQMGILPGSSLFFFDQVDYILGAILFVAWLVPFPLYYYFLAIVLWGSISLLSSYIGFLTRFKKEPI